MVSPGRRSANRPRKRWPLGHLRSRIFSRAFGDTSFARGEEGGGEEENDDDEQEEQEEDAEEEEQVERGGTLKFSSQYMWNNSCEQCIVEQHESL